MGPRSPKLQIEPDRRAKALPEPIPADPVAHFRRKMRKNPAQDAALAHRESDCPLLTWDRNPGDGFSHPPWVIRISA